MRLPTRKKCIAPEVADWGRASQFAGDLSVTPFAVFLRGICFGATEAAFWSLIQETDLGEGRMVIAGELLGEFEPKDEKPEITSAFLRFFWEEEGFWGCVFRFQETHSLRWR